MGLLGFCGLKAGAALMLAAVEQVVTQGDADAGGANPVPAVLALLEQFRLQRPLIII